jgi:hypothetical protein
MDNRSVGQLLDSGNNVEAPAIALYTGQSGYLRVCRQTTRADAKPKDHLDTDNRSTGIFQRLLTGPSSFRLRVPLRSTQT